MPHKVHNELPGVGTTAKTLFSVIYYNVYNLTNLAQMVHQERRKGAPAATLHTWQHRGTRNGAKVHRRQYSTPGSIEAHQEGAKVHRRQYSTPGSIEAHQERKKTGCKQFAARELLKHSI